jgi:hypothetical protein
MKFARKSMWIQAAFGHPKHTSCILFVDINLSATWLQPKSAAKAETRPHQSNKRRVARRQEVIAIR